MKKVYLVISILVFSSFMAVAQQKSVHLDGTHLKPITSVIVELVVKRETVVIGPYARYASQMLGVVAPLNDKSVYSVEAVKIYDSQKGVHSLKGDGRQNYMYGEKMVSTANFVDMGISPVYTPQTGEKNIKTMASDVAAAIFKLRQRRFDLVTGEISEGVLGEGTGAAIKEMARIEKEYLELFLGKQKNEYLTYRYEVVPEKGKDNYIVCRFSQNDGISDVTNISAQPVVLTTIDENRIVVEAIERQKKEVVMTDKFAIADVALCKVTVGDELMAERRLDIFQFGEIKEVKIDQQQPTKK